MKKMKKGFTIVELVIVIAVIGILAGILIPTFSSVIKKSKVSSDQQAVRQMNTVLAVEGVMEDVDIFDMLDVLEEGGLSAKDYKALSAGMSFFWDSEINRVLYVDNATGKATYPEEYKDRANNGKWFSLTQEIRKENVELVSGVASVATAGQLVDVVEKANDNKGVTSVDLNNASVDMMGAALTINKVSSNLEIKDGTIKNATAVEAKTTYKGDNPSNNGIYNMGMITKVAKDATVTFSNVTIKNMNLKDTNAGNCGFLVGTLSGKLILENVTIEDSSIIGYTSVGSLVGYITSSGSIEIKGTLTIKNVKVQGVGGRIGQLIGYYSTGADVVSLSDGASVVMTDVTNTIYTCEQNTGTCVVTGCAHGALGLDNGVIHSWQVDGKKGLNCEKKANRVFNENSLIGYASTEADGDITIAKNTALKTILGLN